MSLPFRQSPISNGMSVRKPATALSCLDVKLDVLVVRIPTEWIIATFFWHGRRSAGPTVARGYVALDHPRV